MSENPTAARDAALDRMSVILDRAAQKEHVSPDVFRAEIKNALACASAQSPTADASDITPEAFVLSLVRELF